MNRRKRTWTVQELAAATGGMLLGGQRVRELPAGMATNDTRALRSGGVFLALQGTNMHGLSLWQQAQQAGAVAVLCGADADATMIRDAHDELGDDVAIVTYPMPGIDMAGVVGRAWRRWAGFHVVGITGSSGKTTCKEITRNLLEQSFTVVASTSNNNNELGVPLTLLSASPDTDVVICEMGMRGLGQIEYLCGIAEPDIGIITSVGSAHLELLGSLENIARAKSEIIAGVGSGTAIIPADRPDLVALSGGAPGRLIRFGAGGDIWVEQCASDDAGIHGTIADTAGWSASFAVPFHGLHNQTNLAAACCVFRALGGTDEQLARALHRPPASWHVNIVGRGERMHTSELGLLINDAYNANPESMRAALDELARAAHASHRVAVLGYMAELGSASAQLHADLGDYAASLPIDELVVVNTHPDVESLAASWKARRMRPPVMVDCADDLLVSTAEWWPGEHGVTLVKASNSVGLGRVIDLFVERYGIADAHQRVPEGNPT